MFKHSGMLFSVKIYVPHLRRLGASLVAQMVKNLPAMRETWVWSLGWEDPLEEGMAIHSSILAWRILMDRGAWQTTVAKTMGLQRVRHNWATKHSTQGSLTKGQKAWVVVVLMSSLHDLRQIIPNFQICFLIYKIKVMDKWFLNYIP